MPITLLTPPSLTTAERDALSSPQEGWGIKNTDLESYEMYVDGAWRTINQPVMITSSYTYNNMTRLSTLTVPVALNKKGYSGAFADVVGVLPGANGYRGVSVRLKGPTATPGYISSLESGPYGGHWTTTTYPNQASAPIYDTTGKIYLRHAYLSEDGSIANFVFYNTDTANPSLVDLSAQFYVTTW